MGNRNLYLHETVDIIGQGQYEYMEHVAKEPTNMMPGGGIEPHSGAPAATTGCVAVCPAARRRRGSLIAA